MQQWLTKTRPDFHVHFTIKVSIFNFLHRAPHEIKVAHTLTYSKPCLPQAIKEQAKVSKVTKKSELRYQHLNR